MRSSGKSSSKMRAKIRQSTVLWTMKPISGLHAVAPRGRRQCLALEAETR
jgi:hypothetical protein